MQVDRGTTAMPNGDGLGTETGKVTGPPRHMPSLSGNNVEDGCQFVAPNENIDIANGTSLMIGIDIAEQTDPLEADRGDALLPQLLDHRPHHIEQSHVQAPSLNHLAATPLAHLLTGTEHLGPKIKQGKQSPARITIHPVEQPGIATAAIEQQLPGLTGPFEVEFGHGHLE